MKTMNTINAMIQEDLETYKETRKALYNAVQVLDGIYKDTIGGKPSETVAAFAGAVGLDMAETVIASLVNRSAWDGRISRNSALWAENVPESWDEDASERIGMVSTIHATHLDQLAQAMQTYAAETRKAQRVAERDAQENKELRDQLREYEYDYRYEVTQDCLKEIREWIEYGYKTTSGQTIPEAFNSDRERLEDFLHDEFWAYDHITGNASGSYTFSTYKAEKYIAHNWDLLTEALEDFGGDLGDAFKNGVEYCDVTIRCYLLAECIVEALEILESEGLLDLPDDTQDNAPEALQEAADASEK